MADQSARTARPTEEQLDRATTAAAQARTRSYVPYSKFQMGAAVIGTDGTEILGTLIENVSLGLAMCSERVALFSAITQQVEPALLALCSQRTDDQLTFPCGACLQVALELAGPDFWIVAVDPNGERDVAHLSDLLPRSPHRFTPKTQPAG